MIHRSRRVVSDKNQIMKGETPNPFRIRNSVSDLVVDYYFRTAGIQLSALCLESGLII